MNFKALVRVILYSEMAEGEFYYTAQEMRNLEDLFKSACASMFTMQGVLGPELADEIMELKEGYPEDGEMSDEALYLLGLLVGWAAHHTTPMCDALGEPCDPEEYQALADMWRLSL